MANIIKILLALFSAISQVAQWMNTKAAQKAGEDSARLEVAKDEAEAREKQDQASVDAAVDIATTDDFADRVRDKGF